MHALPVASNRQHIARNSSNPAAQWLHFAALLALAAWPLPAGAQDAGVSDVETQLGQQVYEQLKAKGEIVATSPLYEVLSPIAARITQAAQPRYEHPFHFLLVRETQPNAFATPGGNVYVTDSLLYFVKNTEELAGTLCHEVSHTIHHDTVELMEKREKIALRELAAGVLIHPTLAQAIAISYLGKLHSLGYSRDVESRADITGSDICGGAGYNPWGLVWLFEDFKNAGLGSVPELLSDHPSDAHRVKALKKHFHDNPAQFSKFDPNPQSASAITVPKNANETFVH